MHLMLRRLLRILWICDIAFIAIVLLYLAVAQACSHYYVPAEAVTSADCVVTLLSNGVHTDLVMPMHSADMDWRSLAHPEDTRSRDTSVRLVAIGWGDKGFYLQTPTWAELQPDVAFKAISGLSTTAMHVTFYRDLPVGEETRVLHISHDQYRRLVLYISSSFQRGSDGNTMLIRTDAVYGDHDCFYEAVGHYSLFHTCNTWTNDALKACGQRASLWTPFQAALMSEDVAQ